MMNINMEKKKIMHDQGLIKNLLIQNIGMEKKKTINSATWRSRAHLLV